MVVYTEVYLALVLRKARAEQLFVGYVHRYHRFYLKLLHIVTVVEKIIPYGQVLVIYYVRLFAHIPQHSAERKAAAQRIAVGAFVGEDKVIIVLFKKFLQFFKFHCG